MIQADSVHSTPPTNTPIGSPAESADALYYPTDISLEEIFQAIGRLRKAARAEIDRLIRFLDESDMELEGVDEDGPGEDTEPSLGSFDRMTDQSKSWRQGHLWDVAEVDAEQDEADREDDDLLEPFGPVVAAAGIDLHRFVDEVNLDAVAVEVDFRGATGCQTAPARSRSPARAR
jgi:hypothetical protein